MKSRPYLIAAGALAVLVLFLVWRARTPPVVGETFSQLPPEQQHQRREEVKQLEAQVNDIAASARRKEHKPFTLTVTEAQLNTILQDRLRTEKFAIRDLRAGLVPERLELQGEVDYKGVKVVATLGGSVKVQNDQMVFNADYLKFGGLPAPSKIKEKVESETNKNLNKLLLNAPGKIDRVTIEQGKMSIEGVTD
jgi:hypothetical protein